MEDTSLRDYLEDNLFDELRYQETLESGLADAIVQEFGKDSTEFTEESWNGVIISYIMEQLSNRISVEIANMNYIVKVTRENRVNQHFIDVVDMSGERQKQAMIPASIGLMLDLIEEDLTEHIDYIRTECFDPELLIESLELNHGVNVQNINIR
tara:strand:+ start:1231 stop:1692 length:462 start_codon:yes stop_codon:yes gene_type:complete